ncbi:MAG: hypothetical protein KDA25_06650 [Phycisphaerales bacterium]|nr:hypothetical protein [Phycisphaerales bacterium]
MNVRLRLLVAAVLAASVATLAPAQDDASPPLLDVDFGGGTVQAYLLAVQKACDTQLAGPLNVVVVGDVARLPLPPIQLRAVDASAAVLVLDQLMIPSPESPGTVQKIRIEAVPSFARLPVYRIEGMSSGRASVPAGKSSGVWSLAELRTEPKIADEDILSAVETALGLFDEPGCDLRFHAPTGLLVARGTDEQIVTIERVLDELRDGRARSDSVIASVARQREMEALKMRIAELEKIIEDLRK